MKKIIKLIKEIIAGIILTGLVILAFQGFGLLHYLCEHNPVVFAIVGIFCIGICFRGAIEGEIKKN